MTLEVRFYDDIDDSLLKFAVIAAKSDHKWVFCRHKDRKTFEVPGGHREPGEAIIDTAKRELYEETGAVNFELRPVSVYSVIEANTEAKVRPETFGMLYYAEISRFEDLPGYEMEEVILQKEYPLEWTYPQIQPILMERIINYLNG